MDETTDDRQAELESSPTTRSRRAMQSLIGLSVGDALGEASLEGRLAFDDKPPKPGSLPWTDDTAMAIEILHELAVHDGFHADCLARRFAISYAREPQRGYGPATSALLRDIGYGLPWRELAAAEFNGEGSMGNGAAMRAGVAGAYFADDFDSVAEQAALSAKPTHAHPDAAAGAIAVAAAAAQAVRMAGQVDDGTELGLLDIAHDLTPEGPTHWGLHLAQETPLDWPVLKAVQKLGNGSRMLCSDTVPLCLWLAARHADSYAEAVLATLSAGGDLDTNCAIVGSIVICSAGFGTMPAAWLQAREPLPEIVLP